VSDARGTDLTAGVVVECDGEFLIIEEYVSGSAVLTQPGGHLEAGESPEGAAERETREESGCVVRACDLLGVYLWVNPRDGQQQLRIMFVADLLERPSGVELDDGIIRVHWMTHEQVRRNTARLRTPFVLRAIEDFRAGRRPDAAALERLAPLHRNLRDVIARASLV